MKKLLATVLTATIILASSTNVFAASGTFRNPERTTIKVGYLDDYGIIMTPIVQGSEGYGFEYLEKIEEYTNFDFEYIDLSWTEGLEQLKSGEIDILAPASMSEGRKETYDFVETVFLHEETNIYALEDSSYQYGEPQQLDGKILGTLEGSIYEERFEKYAQEYGLEYVITYTDISTVSQDIMSGKIDLYIDGSLHLRDDVYSVEKLHSEDLYLMTRKGNDFLKDTINAAMLEIEADDPSYNEFLWYKYYANQSKAPRKLTVDERVALQSKEVYTVGYHADLHPVSYISPSGDPKGYAIDVMNLLADKLGIQIRYVPLHFELKDDTSAEEVDFNLCPLNGDCATTGTMTEPYDTQNLLIVQKEGLIDADIKHILVKDYATIQIDEFLQQYPTAVIHKSCSSTESQHMYDTIDIDCIIIPDRSEMMIYDKTAKSVQVLEVDVPSGIMVSNDLPKGVQTALNKAIESLKKSTVDELIMESMIALQVSPTLMDTLIQYQVQILFVFSLIVMIFAYLLWENQRKTKQLLEVDTLTGVMTQYKFALEARRILSTAKPNEYMLILLDIDKFKNINKGYGTAYGDKLLCTLANNIKEQAKKGAIVGRMQSDVFAILTKASEIPRGVLYEEFVKELKRVGIDIIVYFSTGVYLVENTTDDISFMLDNARMAKSNGKTIFGNTVNYFTKELKEKHEKESMIIASMETALVEEEFYIVVQPKVALRNQKVVGGEVLIRWRQKEGTLIYPDEFIPLFEENQFITKLDHYVLEKTCEFIRDSRGDLPVLSVNVSATTMLETNFIQSGLAVLEQYGVSPQQIEVELTESVLDADYKNIAEAISKLKQAGFSVAIDDFGKGASSLTRIKDIEIDVLKLDKEFMEDNMENEKGKLVLRNIITMANDLGITSLAEGIETVEQHELLIQLGCEHGQGYYFEKPMDLARFSDLLNKVMED